MSGPIIRKYGFPNFEKIFGERPLEHGVDEPNLDEKAADQPESSKPDAEASKSRKSTGSKSKKKSS